ncbi:MAG: hypothetical protein ND866_08430 [Pyrinomonadaceae bacterium]|nr:hypothetical protein [Pyrinomonadaceae bacterium]
MPAPVMITTYSRLNHLQRTIEELKKNELADETTVYVYLDGPKPGDEEKVEAVRKYLTTVTGFAAFHVVERQQNMGAHENAKLANYEVLDKHGSIIRMEDDIVTAPWFLRFMNLALVKYKDDHNVFSISGYCVPMKIPEDYQYDALFLQKFEGWGCGIWRDRLDDVYHQITLEEFKKFASNKKLCRAFLNGGRRDMLTMLELVANGKLEAADVVAWYIQFLKNQYTLFPTQSLVKNIGMEGSGVHCGVTDFFNAPLSDKTSFHLPDQLIIDHRILKSHRKFWNDYLDQNKPGIFRRLNNMPIRLSMYLRSLVSG